MPITNKIVSKLNVGNKLFLSDVKDKTLFYELDDILSSLKIPSGSLRENLTTIINDLVSNPTKQNIERLLVALSIGNADDKLLEIFSLSNITDPMMFITGKYFVEDSTTKTIKKNNSSNYIFRIYQPTTTKLSTNSTSVSVEINDSIFRSFVEVFLPKTFQIIKLLNALGEFFIYLLKIIFIYSLYSFVELNPSSYYLAYEKNVYQQKTEDSLFAYFNVNNEYNFYIDNYENIFNSNFLYESMIPNYHAVNSYIANNNLNVTQHLNLGSNIDVTKQNIATQNYFSDFASVVNQNLNNTNFLNFYSSLTKNILIDTISKNSFEISTENFPYVNKINFYNTENNISNYLLENELDYLTLNNCYSLFYGLATINENVIIENNVVNKVFDSNGNLKDVNGQKYYKQTSTSTITGTIAKLPYDSIFTFLTNSPFGFNVLSNNALKFDNNLSNLQNPTNIFRYLKLNKFINDSYKKFDSYDYVSDLNLLSCDTVCYFLEKVDGTRLLQTIGMPTENATEINYNDTQVVYNKNITYNVYSCDLVPVISLQYSGLNLATPLSLSFNINNKIVPHIFKNLIFTKTNKISDSPPLAPDVKFVTYQNINNTITMLFNESVGSIEEKPITIFAGVGDEFGGDDAIFENIQNCQNKENGKILFESDSGIKTIQIFYTTQQPVSYLDFARGTLLEFNFDNFKSTSTSLNINPNVKYYFTFRSVDVHGLISNPSDVFEVQIIDNDGAIYPIVQTFSFNNQMNYLVNKSFKKYLSITPSIPYTDIFLNENEIKYGVDDKLWNQKFKVRVTSKSSGKSFDINLSFIKKVQDLT